MDPFSFLSSLERLGMKFGLENIGTLCAALGHPERTFKSIVIAGTNGKGSVTVMVETALRAAGHHTARYTSPHLVRLEERFVIDGREVETPVLADVVGTIQTTVETLVASGTLEALPTFFECTTAAAFELFRRAHVDLAVLEVGLGGRLDATNIVTPIVTAITSIDFDHQAQLGNTLASIAAEKAGIAKPGVPMVCGRVPEAAARVIEQVCDLQHAPLVHVSKRVQILAHDRDDSIDVKLESRSLDRIRLSLPGRHQRENAAVAIAILEEVSARGTRVDDAAIRKGLTAAEWPARLERFVHDDVEILLDAAHNPAGARAMASHLQDIGWSRITLLFAAMRDKDISGMLAPLAHVCARVICTSAPTPRSLPAEELAAIARLFVPAVETEPDMREAFDRAIGYRMPVVAAGSIFLIGPLRDILR
jgi:dihydrofolate synthase / folylpolyglutamate synthase